MALVRQSYQARAVRVAAALALLVTAACGGRAVAASGGRSTSADAGGVADVESGDAASSDAGASGREAGSSGSNGSEGPDACAGAAGTGDASSADAEVPSCAPGGPGLSDCGPSSESCCTSLETSGGTYYRTYANDGGGATGLADPATVSVFRLDKYLVTVGRFRQFVAAVLPADGGAGWLPVAGSGKHTFLNCGQGLANAVPDAGMTYEPGWDPSDDTAIAPTDANLDCNVPASGTLFSALTEATWTPTVGANENLPINCVDWQEAYAFCIWDGGFLPSEAEWEAAAAGGNEQREYPWGEADPSSNLYAIYGWNYPDGGTAGTANIAPVGTTTLGTGRYGQVDLAGEVWEWALDWYRPYVNPCVDCAVLTAPSSTAWRANRGGDFGSDTSVLTASNRNDEPPSVRDIAVGVRCARAP